MRWISEQTMRLWTPNYRKRIRCWSALPQNTPQGTACGRPHGVAQGPPHQGAQSIDSGAHSWNQEGNVFAKSSLKPIVEMGPPVAPPPPPSSTVPIPGFVRTPCRPAVSQVPWPRFWFLAPLASSVPDTRLRQPRREDLSLRDLSMNPAVPWPSSVAIHGGPVWGIGLA